MITTYQDSEKDNVWKHHGKRRKCQFPEPFPFLTVFSILSKMNFVIWATFILTLKKKPFENIVGKGENAANQHFVLFPWCFLSCQKHKLGFLATFYLLFGKKLTSKYLCVSQCFFFCIAEISHNMVGKFHFVDLAGSERAHKTGNVGDRFKGNPLLYPFFGPAWLKLRGKMYIHDLDSLDFSCSGSFWFFMEMSFSRTL